MTTHLSFCHAQTGRYYRDQEAGQTKKDNDHHQSQSDKKKILKSNDNNKSKIHN